MPLCSQWPGLSLFSIHREQLIVYEGPPCLNGLDRNLNFVSINPCAHSLLQFLIFKLNMIFFFYATGLPLEYSSSQKGKSAALECWRLPGLRRQLQGWKVLSPKRAFPSPVREVSRALAGQLGFLPLEMAPFPAHLCRQQCVSSGKWVKYQRQAWG